MYRVYTFPFLCLFFYTQTCPLPYQPLLKNVLGKFLHCCAERLLPDTVLCLPHEICEKRGEKIKEQAQCYKNQFRIFLNYKFKVTIPTIPNTVLCKQNENL